MGIYTGIIIGSILINFIRTIAFFFVCVNASRVLHDRMFHSILRAPILFFDINPIGRVLNRFSKDVGYLDDLLPFHFCEYMLVSQCACNYMVDMAYLDCYTNRCTTNHTTHVPAYIYRYTSHTHMHRTCTHTYTLAYV